MFPRFPGRCHKTQYHGPVYYDQCKNKGILEEAGSKWCRIHAPSIVREKEKKRSEARKKKYDAERALWDRQNLLNEAREEVLEAAQEFIFNDVVMNRLQTAVVRLRDLEDNP